MGGNADQANAARGESTLIASRSWSRRAPAVAGV
jgi:hypothetical protein